jgi:hypothetical protein
MTNNDFIFLENYNTSEKKGYPEEKGERISNPDGTITKETVDKAQVHQILDKVPNFDPSILSIYDPRNPDRQLFDMIEQELIYISSSPIKYWKLVKVKESIDSLYGEQNVRKTYKNPVIIYGLYEQPVPAFIVEKFGAKTGEELEIKFNVNYLVHTINDQMLQEGDILQTYDGKLWEVINSVITDETLYRVQHNIVRCVRLITEGIDLPGLGDIS